MVVSGSVASPGGKAPQQYRKPRQHGIVYRLMQEGAAGGATGLAAPPEVHARNDRLHDRVRIRIAERDERVLAAQLQQHGFDRIGGRVQHRPACRDAADQCDLGNCGVGGQVRRLWPGHRQHVEDTGRKQRSDKFREPQRGQRGLVRRLDDDGIAGSKDCCGLARAEQQWMVERQEPGNNAQWFANGEVHAVRAQWNGAALHLGHEACKELHLFRGGIGVAAHLAIGIATVGRIEHGQFRAVLADDGCGGAQHPCSIRWRDLPPQGIARSAPPRSQPRHPHRWPG
jgi:hypothetical protein